MYSRTFGEGSLHSKIVLCSIPVTSRLLLLMTDPDTTPAAIDEKLRVLEALTRNLPTSLPSPEANDSIYYGFTNFALDPDVIERVESEAGAFNEAMKGIFGFQTRTTGDGILNITERGPAICASVDVFRWAMAKFPGDAVVEKWLVDVITGLKKTYEDAGVPVSSGMNSESERGYLPTNDIQQGS